MNTAAPFVRLDVWGVSGAAVLGSFLRMGTQRRAVRAMPGLTFAKLLGTGSGETFTMRDADPKHWALLTTWADDSHARALDQSRIARAWNRSANEHLTVTMQPRVSRGKWSGHEPFAVPDTKAGPGPIAAITRARIKPQMWTKFWSSVPPVSLDLHEDPGVVFTLGIGEAPVGLQGTFSIWRDAKAISDFAYRRPAHAEVVRRTHELNWYAEEMFTRFQVLDVSGTYNSLPVSV
jgi:heme-degrading monooxygenase HmoA